MDEKPIGISVREAAKGWTYSLIVECDDGDGEKYPDSMWTAEAFSDYFEAYEAATMAAMIEGTEVIGKKMTQEDLDKYYERKAEFLKKVNSAE